MKYSLKCLTLAVASTSLLALSGCGGGGGGGGGDGGIQSSTVTVVPSLGQFTSGTDVQLTNPVNGTVLASGKLDATGSVNLTVSGYSGAIVVEVKGNDTSKYYDEGTGSLQTFAKGKSLRAVMSGLRDKIGVTALTNAAVAKLEDATGKLTEVNATKIDDANAKVAMATGMGSADILQAPTLVNGPATLGVATTADKYALLLAGLAKTATGTTTAADVADALALDLKDDKFDGKNSTGAVIANAPTPTTLNNGYRAAAVNLTSLTDSTVIQNSTLPTRLDVSTVTATLTSDINLAKAMFAELRTTLSSFYNGSTGFLDTQAKKAGDDLKANVAPNMEKVASRIGALTETMIMYDDGKAYSAASNTFGLQSGSVPGATLNTTATGLYRSSGSLQAVWYGYGSFTFCWTDSATGVSSKVSCAHAGQDSADWANNRIKFVTYEMTSSATNQYAYTATRINRAVTLSQGSMGLLVTLGTASPVTADPAGNPMPVGSGTMSKALSGSTLTSFAINGTLPPSATSGTGTALATGADTIAISAARTALTGNNYRYALTGSVSTSKLTPNVTTGAVDSTKVVTLSFDSGSYVDIDETVALTHGPWAIGGKLIGTAQTTATKFTGTIDVGSFVTDKSGYNRMPTSIVFNGVISDLSTGGAGAFLTGKLEAAVADYNLFDSRFQETSTNYEKTSATFTGTVQAPSRPLLKLVVAGNRTGLNSNTVTLNYSYGSTVSITGTGTGDGSSNSLTLSNQDGIQIARNTTTGGWTVSKASTTLATIANGMINYTDSVSEALGW